MIERIYTIGASSAQWIDSLYYEKTAMYILEPLGGMPEMQFAEEYLRLRFWPAFYLVALVEFLLY